MSNHYGGHSMSSRLRRVMVCSPRTAGWDDGERANQWRDMGYIHRPDFNKAQAEHDQLTHLLEKLGAEVISLPEGDHLSIDAVYPHDASLMTDFGALCLRMGKLDRAGEPAHHARFFHRADIPVLGTVREPGTVESGDAVWLDATTLLVGRGYRTNDDGIEQVRRWLGPKGIEVIAAPLPHGNGPGSCLHLMSLMSVLDQKVVLIDQPWLSVSTVELLLSRGFELIDIFSSERDTMACNVLALGNRRLIALAENTKTVGHLRQRGFEVETFSGSELCQNGGGGPTCLTRPLLRE